MNLSADQEDIIKQTLEALFETIKARFLGTHYAGPALYFEIARKQNPLDTVGGIFEYALRTTTKNPEIDHDLINKLANTTDNYIEAEKQRAMQRILDGVETVTAPDDIKAVVQASIDKSNNYIDMLMATETRNVQAQGEMSGIQQVGASLGVDDPTIARLGVWDSKICDACMKLWHQPDNPKIPRVWKMSELQGGYNTDQKNPVPTINATHPRCRHILTIIPPNFGFDWSGNITFKSFGYDVYDDQKGISKNERSFRNEGTTQDINEFIGMHHDCDHQ